LSIESPCFAEKLKLKIAVRRFINPNGGRVEKLCNAQIKSPPVIDRGTSDFCMGKTQIFQKAVIDETTSHSTKPARWQVAGYSAQAGIQS
jgi:hypothetical protein